MSERTEKMAGFLREVSNWYWDDFVKAEKDKASYSSNQAIIFALIRACAAKNMTAIKMSINRLDGKLKTPIKIEYPKVFFLYPNATLPEGYKPPLLGGDAETADFAEAEVVDIPLPPEPAQTDKDLPSLTFRETVAKMSDYPREVPEQIVERALQTEQWLRNAAPPPPTMYRVKAVVAAHLLMMSQKGNMDAIGEVFDSIDGKLVETIQLLGDDLFITNYSAIAPPGARPNKDGVLMMEATDTQKMWANKLAQEK